jgi:hypothetical protein
MQRNETSPQSLLPRAPDPLGRLCNLQELRAAAGLPTHWLWHGYLAAGGVTLLTGQWKVGKTTLLSALLAQLKTGGELGGRTVSAGRAVVVSEEGAEHWVRRAERFDLSGELRWLCRPFSGRPSREQWLALLDRLAELALTEEVGLFVIDPLASFLPGYEENSAAALLDALGPLTRVTSMGAAVLLMHHPRKYTRSEGQLARGSGALSGFVDVLLEMSWLRAPSADDRRRRLRAWSRYDETPRQLVIELDEAGTGYRAHGSEDQTESAEGWAALRRALEGVSGRLTRHEVRERWPADVPPPSAATVWRWLEQAVARGQVVRTGSGRRNNPFRYALPGRSLPDEGPLLPPLAEELGLSEQELAEVELGHLQKLLRQRRQDETVEE